MDKYKVDLLQQIINSAFLLMNELNIEQKQRDDLKKNYLYFLIRKLLRQAKSKRKNCVNLNADKAQ